MHGYGRTGTHEDRLGKGFPIVRGAMPNARLHARLHARLQHACLHAHLKVGDDGHVALDAELRRLYRHHLLAYVNPQ